MSLAHASGMDRNVIRVYADHTITHAPVTINCNIIPSLTLSFYKCSVPFSFQTKLLYTHFPFPMPNTCYCRLIFIDVIRQQNSRRLYFVDQSSVILSSILLILPHMSVYYPQQFGPSRFQNISSHFVFLPPEMGDVT